MQISLLRIKCKNKLASQGHTAIKCSLLDEHKYARVSTEVRRLGFNFGERGILLRRQAF